MRRTYLPLVCFALFARTSGAQQFVLSAQPKVVISSESDPSAQFKTLLGVGRFASGEIALGTFDPIGINLYSAKGSFVRSLARPGEGPGEMRMPDFFGRRADSLVTFDLGLRRVTYYANAGATRQALVRLPRARGHFPSVRGVFPNGALLIVQVPYTRPPAPDGPVRDRHAIVILSADTAAPPIPLGEHAGYGLVYFTPRGEHEPHFLMDLLTSGTTWMMVGDQAAIADPDQPAVLMYSATGKLTRRIVLPVRPRPFDPKAVREARERAAPVVLGEKQAKSPARAALDKTHFELMFDLSKRPKTAPYFRRLVRGTDGTVWVELYREHIGRPSECLRIDASGKVSGRLNGPANVQFHEFGADYALGVRIDPDTDLQSIVLYALRKR